MKSLMLVLVSICILNATEYAGTFKSITKLMYGLLYKVCIENTEEQCGFIFPTQSDGHNTIKYMCYLMQNSYGNNIVNFNMEENEILDFKIRPVIMDNGYINFNFSFQQVYTSMGYTSSIFISKFQGGDFIYTFDKNGTSEYYRKPFRIKDGYTGNGFEALKRIFYTAHMYYPNVTLEIVDKDTYWLASYNQ